MKATTTSRRAQGPTLGDLLRAAGKKPAHVETETGLSASTVYRAMRGEVPTDANVRLIAGVIGCDEVTVREAIARGKKGPVGRPRAQGGRMIHRGAS